MIAYRPDLEAAQVLLRAERALGDRLDGCARQQRGRGGAGAEAAELDVQTRQDLHATGASHDEPLRCTGHQEPRGCPWLDDSPGAVKCLHSTH